MKKIIEIEDEKVTLDGVFLGNVDDIYLNFFQKNSFLTGLIRLDYAIEMMKKSQNMPNLIDDANK